MHIVFLGPPGSGKGTQADFLRKELGIAHISTGELLRQEIADNTAQGIDARRYVEAGSLVPDAVVLSILEKKVSQPDCQKGFILDGFPRTIVQAESLENDGIALHRVFYFEVSEAQVIDRLGGRLYCKECGTFYHNRYNPPKHAAICDTCNRELLRRADDDPVAIHKRLTEYREKTQPVVDFYKSRSMLSIIDASLSIEIIRAQLLKEVHS